MIDDTDSRAALLVIGGPSDLGNRVSHAFRRCNAHVLVWGTRASAADYNEGADMSGPGCAWFDVGDAD